MPKLQHTNKLVSIVDGICVWCWKCRDALNCIGSYYITASVCVQSVLNTLSETMCGNLIIPGKLSHVLMGFVVVNKQLFFLE